MRKWPAFILSWALVAAPGAASATDLGDLGRTSAADLGRICYDPQGRPIPCAAPTQAEPEIDPFLIAGGLAAAGAGVAIGVAVTSGRHNGNNIPFVPPVPVSP